MIEKCVWCKEKPRKEGLALCEECHELQESDELNQHVIDGDYHFRCPECGVDIGGRIICPTCGITRMMVLSIPSHCDRCHSQFSYRDASGQTRCWMCRAKWTGSSIDKYIKFALQNWEKYEEWSDGKEKTTAVGE